MQIKCLTSTKLFHTQDRNSKVRGGIQALTNCPSCILSLENGLELMRESGEPMEFGIFDYSKVFTRTFGEGGWGSRDLKWKQGDVVMDLGIEFQGIRTMFEGLEIFQLGFFFF